MEDIVSGNISLGLDVVRETRKGVIGGQKGVVVYLYYVINK